MREYTECTLSMEQATELLWLLNIPELELSLAMQKFATLMHAEDYLMVTMDKDGCVCTLYWDHNDGAIPEHSYYSHGLGVDAIYTCMLAELRQQKYYAENQLKVEF